MANINVNELTQEQIEKAMACETAEELMAAAKEEAEAYMAEMADIELDDEALRNVAGGGYLQFIYKTTKKVMHKIL